MIHGKERILIKRIELIKDKSAVINFIRLEKNILLIFLGS